MPTWLAHPLGWSRAPVPWAAMLRGALGAGPLLALGLLSGHPGQAVLAGVAAMLAGVNDRAGTRRSGVVRIGLPACAGALGVLCGGLLADGGERWGTQWGAVPALFAVGLVSGAVSVAGPVWSAAGMQTLVTTALGAGAPAPGPAWLDAGCYLCGAGWLLLLRLVLRTPGGLRRGPEEDEREAVAAVFDALADALSTLAAPGTPSAPGRGGQDAAARVRAARRGMADAQQHAEQALRVRQALSWPPLRRVRGAGDRARGNLAGTGRAHAHGWALAERLRAAVALGEAGTALLWADSPVTPQVAAGPRRLAAAVRKGTAPGALAAPLPDTAERAAFDRALLQAAVVFDRTAHGRADRAHVPEAPQPPSSGRSHRGVGAPRGRLLRGAGVSGPLGRRYGLRVALCVTLSTAVALWLHESHWYWLPVTAAFLVKPDMGPLFSRVVNRFAGTAAGVLACTAATAAATGLGLGGSGWPIVTVAAAGALIPVATRHFGLLTAVVTVLVLSLLRLAGDTEATAARLLDTGLACGIVLLVGHLPCFTDPRVQVGHRCAVALRCTERYLRHVLEGPPQAGGPSTPATRSASPDPRLADPRLADRHLAHRALAHARAAAETAAAELPGPRRSHRHDWQAVLARTERLTDAATACALRLERGVPRPPAAEVRQVTAALRAMADALESGRGTNGLTLPPGPSRCRTLDDVMAQLHRINDLTTAA